MMATCGDAPTVIVRGAVVAIKLVRKSGLYHSLKATQQSGIEQVMGSSTLPCA